MRKDFIFIGLLLIISALFSYYKGYIGSGIGAIMTSCGGYIGLIGLFFKQHIKQFPPKKNSLPNK